MNKIRHIDIEKIQHNLNSLEPKQVLELLNTESNKWLQNPDKLKNLISDIQHKQNILVFDNFNEPNELIGITAHPIVKFNFNFSAFIKEGTMTIRIGHKEYDLKRNDWYTVMSGKIYQSVRISPDAKIGVCCIHEESYNFHPKGFKIMDIYKQLVNYPVIHFSEENAIEYQRTFKYLKKYLNKQEHPCQQELIKCYYNLSFLILCSELQFNNTTTKHKTSRKEVICQSFLSYLEKYYKSEHSVKFYAEKLCITPKYLSSVIYLISGKHASEWIDDHLILEAKALLITTDMSVQEIAYDLNFSTPAHFSVFFKRLTGYSPKRYRMRP